MEEFGILYALVLTIIIEYIVLRCLGEKRRRILLASVAINIMTNIPLNLIVSSYSFGLTTILMLESLVVIIEAAWYYLFTKDLSQSLVYSLLCNSISFLTGILIELILVSLRLL